MLSRIEPLRAAKTEPLIFVENGLDWSFDTKGKQMALSSLYAQYSRLTAGERAYLRTYPLDAIAIANAREFALAETERLFGKAGHNDSSDAFRHCLWSAILARDIGAANALAFTSAHEDFPVNPAAERMMDLHNNRVGIQIGATKDSNDGLSRRCMTALSLGRLKILKK